MSQPLRYAEYQWFDRDEIESLDVCNVNDDYDIGYILEVDLHYPESLRNLYSDFPPHPYGNALHQKCCHHFLNISMRYFSIHQLAHSRQ